MQATDMSRRLPIGAELSEWRGIVVRPVPDGETDA
jgi:hypothetical protein